MGCFSYASENFPVIDINHMLNSIIQSPQLIMLSPSIFKQDSNLHNQDQYENVENSYVYVSEQLVNTHVLLCKKKQISR